MQTTTAEQIVIRLKEADFPSKIIPSVVKEIESFQPEAEKLFAFWYDKDRLEDDAFDLLGITPGVIREKFRGISDVGVLIVYNHLITNMRNDFASMCFHVGLREKINILERNIGKQMVQG